MACDADSVLSQLSGGATSMKARCRMKGSEGLIPAMFFGAFRARAGARSHAIDPGWQAK